METGSPASRAARFSRSNLPVFFWPRTLAISKFIGGNLKPRRAAARISRIQTRDPPVLRGPPQWSFPCCTLRPLHPPGARNRQATARRKVGTPHPRSYMEPKKRSASRFTERHSREHPPGIHGMVLDPVGIHGEPSLRVGIAGLRGVLQLCEGLVIAPTCLLGEAAVLERHRGRPEGCRSHGRPGARSCGRVGSRPTPRAPAASASRSPRSHSERFRPRLPSLQRGALLKK